MLFEHLRFTSHAHAMFLCFVFVLVFFSVDDYRTDRGVWIGLNDVTGSGSYEWEHNTTLVYTKWANGEPGLLPIMAHTGRLRPKGIPFHIPEA